jgi:hypothetical protein
MVPAEADATDDADDADDADAAGGATDTGKKED